MNPTPFEINERQQAFQKWWRTALRKNKRWPYDALHPGNQGWVHEMVKTAFNAGTNYERQKNEPIKTGGYI